MSVISNVTERNVLDDLSIKHKQQGKETSDKDMFMRLMLAQLEQQNPLQPQDGADFLAQLAQFSTLEGIGKLNASVQDMVGMYRSTQALQATTLVGRDVLVNSNQVYLEPGGGVSGVIHPDGVAAGDVSMAITDQVGQVVRQVHLGNLGSQDTPFAWDGTDANGNPLPPGNYKIAIQAMVAGKHEAMNISTFARVNSVSVINNQGDMQLNLNGLGQVSSADIKQVR